MASLLMIRVTLTFGAARTAAGPSRGSLGLNPGRIRATSLCQLLLAAFGHGAIKAATASV
jgi:hypothetical protein